MRKTVLLFFLVLLQIPLVAQQRKLSDYLTAAKNPSDSSKIYFTKALRLVNSKADSINYLVAKTDYFLAQRIEDSIAFYGEKVIKKANHLSHYKKIILLCRKLGHFYEESGSFDKSIKIHQKGLQIGEAYSDYIAVSEMLIDISQTYRIFHDYKKAIEYGKKASQTLEKNNINDLRAKAEAFSITAAAFTENKELDSALYYHKKVLGFLPRIDSLAVKNTIVNIGYTLMELNRLEESRVYTEKGLALFKPLKNDYAIASIYTNLGMYGNRAKKYNYALRMFDSAVYYTKKSKYIETLFWIYDERAQVYEKQQNYKKAYENVLMLNKVKDSVFKAKRANTIQEMEAKYQTAKKEKEIAIQKQELLDQKLKIKNRNLYIILISGAFLMIIIISIGFYKRQQFKKQQLLKEFDLKNALSKIKTQNKLQKQRLEISRDLHDNIGSQLTFIISSLDNLKFATNDVGEKLQKKLTQLSAFTSETIHQLRDTIWAMNRNEITIEDFLTRIMSYIDKVKMIKPELKFTVKNKINDDLIFSSIEGMNLFRVIQEAINNTIKHAEATQIDIQFIRENDEIHISIKDNGKGFDLKNYDAGNGLSNIEARITNIEGKVFINTQINKGTHILIKINA